VAGFDMPVRWTTAFSNAGGWSDEKYYATMRLTDVNGDGMADVCARGAAGIYCGISYGTGVNGYTFGNAAHLTLAAFTDAGGWGAPEHYRTLFFADVDGNGNADVCGRGATGVHCALARTYAQGAASGWNTLFDPSQQWTAQFGDNGGWDALEGYWGTVQPANMRLDAGTEVCGRGDGGDIWCSNR
jgi:hypothetical protein